MNFVRQSHKELLIHHSVQGKQLTSGFVLGVDALADCHDMDAMEFKDLDCAKRILDIAGEPRCVIDQKSIEGTRILLRCLYEALEGIPAGEGRCSDCPIGADIIIHNYPTVLTGCVFPA